MDPRLIEIVAPFYMGLFGAGFMRLNPKLKTTFVVKLNSVRRTVEHSEIEELFQTLEWRGRLVAAWIAGLNRWSQFEDEIGQLLVDSEVCFSGQGYCVALALFQNEQSVKWLKTYLDLYLSQTDKHYDQQWALSALCWLDETQGSNFAEKYLAPNGPWDKFILGKTEHGRWDIEKRRDGFKTIMEECTRLFPVG